MSTHPGQERRRRADDFPPPGQRTGDGVDSLLPYLAQSLASKPRPGPPGGVERRSRPRDNDAS